MTNDFMKKGIRAMRAQRLSDTEKVAMLARLDAHTRAHPAPAQPARDLASRLRDNLANFSYEYAMAMILILAVTGGGVASAAEGALPGDPLYPVKVYVNEPVQGALAITNIQKAAWQATLAVRRLEEAETLQTEGRLTASSTQEIKEHFSKNVANFNGIVHRARVENVATTTLDDEGIRFREQLEKHSRILSVVDAASTTPSVALPSRTHETGHDSDDEQRSKDKHVTPTATSTQSSRSFIPEDDSHDRGEVEGASAAPSAERDSVESHRNSGGHARTQEHDD